MTLESEFIKVEESSQNYIVKSINVWLYSDVLLIQLGAQWNCGSRFGI